MIFILTLIILIILILFILFATFFHIIPLFYGAPYEGTDKKVMTNMIRLSKPLKNKKMCDIGSGDGRLVIEFAKAGAEAHGYEINPLLVLTSKYKIRKLVLKGKAFIHWKNFWEEDLSKYNIITTFQIYYLMPKLESKLKSELKPSSLILSNKWVFPNLKLKKKLGRINVYKI